jgi:hypothetical protein
MQPEPSRLRAQLKSAGWLLLAILVLRSAGFLFGILNIDECDFALIAKRISQGALPYLDVVDIKPPLTYLVYLPAGMFGPANILPIHILGVLWLWATALTLARAARLWTGSDDAGTAAAWLAVIACSCEIPSTSSELLMALPLAGALLFWVRGRPLDDWLAGGCVGLASLFRHQGAVVLIALGLALLLRRAPRRAFVLCVGFALPWLLTFAVYAVKGHLPELWDWVIARNFLYAAGGHAGPVLAHAVAAIALCVGAVVLPWALATAETFWPTQRGPQRTGIVLSLWLTWIAVSLGGRFYEHYFLQFVPPLALLAAPRAGRLLQSWPQLLRRQRALWAALAILPSLGLLGYSIARGVTGRYPEQEPRSRAVAAWLLSNTAPADRLFIWGHYSPIYYLSHRLPGTRYLTTSVQVGNFDPGQLPDGFDVSPYRSDRDVALAIKDLEANRVPVFVDTAPSGIHHWDRVPLSTVPLLARYLESNYRLEATVAGSRVYRRVN